MGSFPLIQGQWLLPTRGEHRLERGQQPDAWGYCQVNGTVRATFSGRNRAGEGATLRRQPAISLTSFPLDAPSARPCSFQGADSVHPPLVAAFCRAAWPSMASLRAAYLRTSRPETAARRSRRPRRGNSLRLPDGEGYQRAIVVTSDGRHFGARIAKIIRKELADATNAPVTTA
jgi:hypothetical protein